MMSISDVIKSLEENGIVVVKNQTSISFGTREQCEEFFYEAFKQVDKSIQEIKHLPEYESIIDWMADTKGKGLFIQGSCGVGKSIITRCILPILIKQRLNKLLIPVQAQDINALKEPTKQWAYCIDDVGTEGIKNDFGDKHYVIKDILEDAERNNKLVFMNTNLNGHAFIERYDKRSLDRVCKLCKIVKIEGNSMRAV